MIINGVEFGNEHRSITLTAVIAELDWQYGNVRHSRSEAQSQPFREAAKRLEELRTALEQESNGCGASIAAERGS